MKMMAEKTTGGISLQKLYAKQIEFQEEVLEQRAGEGQPVIAIPQDVLQWFSYHVQAMVEELGELMKADKRWKTHRNERYELEEKVDEIADVFITAMNIAIYSGMSGEELEKAVSKKIESNMEKLKGKVKQNDK